MAPQQRRKAVICLPPDNPDAITELVPMAADVLAEREEKRLEETELENKFEEPYILVRIMDSDEDDFYVDFEHSGFLGRDEAMNFLRQLIDHGKDA